MLTLLMLAAAAAGSPTEGKVMAQDDWHAMTVVQVGISAAGFFHVHGF